MDGFTLNIETGNAAMQTAGDVADALRETADRVESGATSAPARVGGRIRDPNGNTVGEWSLELPEPELDPWADDAAWGDVDFEPFTVDPDTGQPPDGTDYLFNIADGEDFTDRDGERFTKVADGPVQGACVVTDDEGTFAQLAGDELFELG